MKKFLFPCLLILALFCSCVTSKPPEKKRGNMNVRNGATISVGGICRGDITGDGKGPYLKSILISEIHIEKDFVGMTPLRN